MLLVRGVGLGAVTIPLMAVGFVGLARDEIPHASIITRISMQVGGAVGVAVLAVVLQRATAVVLRRRPSSARSGGRPASPPSPCCCRSSCRASAPAAGAPVGERLEPVGA